MGGNIVLEAAQQNSTYVACLLWFITLEVFASAGKETDWSSCKQKVNR
jgi:hypothetical protein